MALALSARRLTAFNVPSYVIRSRVVSLCSWLSVHGVTHASWSLKTHGLP